MCVQILGSNPANSETAGDESPSRMRTRNKQAKESNNKRPKRGGDTPDSSATNENSKTPNKTDRRRSTKETPTKGKKRTNIDLDIENDGSDEKEKRKRTEVISDCVYLLALLETKSLFQTFSGYF